MPAVGNVEDEGDGDSEPSGEPNSDGESEHEYMPKSLSGPSQNIHHHVPPDSHPFGAAGSAPGSRYFGYFNDRVSTPPKGDNSITHWSHRGTPSYSPVGYRGEYLFDKGTAGPRSDAMADREPEVTREAVASVRWISRWRSV
ncbi:hypothetical protein LTR91_018151 [Friedmanniomyces endolithicus]|uniref:Uncharacterized protein n=1 Tax=Friedmanniomyces endolithicus TaxID=329885 RepID=A0AAN6HCZ1_9PEZI|nr:hypothetical protein LTR38_015528 [Friedmanniomyces endolithicus]KAK0833453.1 hypothetical protein LTR03_014759 [Friedmanniomyces endolithicus]KAK0873124.1 hypothetical protein LTR87_012106 [Friedmanniomyces endolithicus]KAK0890723.1 hypothetical protein LTR02_014509 [Friedmanniomyces endolithicus]KAK0965086.1 hypothetical protein LTR91_018151 [Friedmanniomyces endolithicus]